MRTHDFARAIAQKINQASAANHVTTVEPTEAILFGGPVAAARWFCTCGVKSDSDELHPPTAERQAAQHVEQEARATRPRQSMVAATDQL